MLFNSIEFLIFFPIVAILYFLTPSKYKWTLLLSVSYYFYMSWKPQYIIFMLLTTIVVYLSGIKIENSRTQKQKNIFLTMCLAINLGVLFLFKYFNFFNNSLEQLAAYFNIKYSIPDFSFLLPIGISFYTFQALSYIIDVYRGNIKAEHHFGIFSLYVSFFPQIASGPITRADKLIPQFYENHRFDYKRVTDGLKIMAWGFFKKVVIADRIAILVNTVYNNPYSYYGFPLILATIAFTIQIYCDFSGYSDIAIGCAKVMGFDLMKNFEAPYFSKSISEFWRRWHISLSSWLRDYVYISLGGSRTSKIKWYRNLLLTFFVSGLWHGANWTYVVWGLLHGIYQVISKLTYKIRNRFVSTIGLDKKPKLYGLIQIVIVFCLVSFAWIFFRANSLSDAVYIISNLFKGLSIESLNSAIINLGLGKIDLIILFISILALFTVDFMSLKKDVLQSLSNKPVVIRWAVYYILITSILAFGMYGYKEFIYIQF